MSEVKDPWAVVMAWRNNGFAFQDFLQAAKLGPASPLHMRFQELVAKDPPWESWVDGHQQLWERILEYGAEGLTVPEAIERMALSRQTDIDTIDERDQTITEKNHVIETGTQENAGQKRAIDELERDNKELRRDNKNLREALAAWQKYADNPQRGLLGRWRR